MDHYPDLYFFSERYPFGIRAPTTLAFEATYGEINCEDLLFAYNPTIKCWYVKEIGYKFFEFEITEAPKEYQMIIDFLD